MIRRPLIHLWSNERPPAAGRQRLRGLGGTEGLSPGRRAKLLAGLAAELESRDPWTHGHSGRVALYAAMTVVADVDAFCECYVDRLPLPLWHPQRKAVPQLAV